ncbi:MAG: adenylate/guanylate cyclase domain-containing protein [Elusimicrobiales bacterium]|nr:adenylate/guanylate cyclase domain-containing protein [Elusimicrobiales bacterium]
MFRKDYKKLYVFSIFITLFFIIFYILDFIFETDLILGTFEKKWFDYKVNYNYVIDNLMGTVPKKADERIFIVGIDDSTIEKYGWPFPRKYYAFAIKNLEKWGVKVIVFDILFIDPDRKDPLSDKIFADTVSKYDNIIFGVSIGEDLKIRVPYKELRLSSKYFGSIYAGNILDYDGNIRKTYPFLPEVVYGESFKNYYYGDVCPHCDDEVKFVRIPALGTMAYIKYMNYNLKEFFGVWKDKKFYFNFRKSRKLDNNISFTTMYKAISLKDVIEGTVDEEEKKALKGAVVFIGSIAQGAYDHYSTPLDHHTPGVEINALCFDNLINNDYFRNIPSYINIIITILVIWWPVILIKSSSIKIAVYNFILIMILMFLSLWLVKYNINQYFLAFLLPNIVSFTFVVTYKSIFEDKQKKWIKNTFSQYLSPEVVDILVKDPSKLKLGGERKDLSVFFMDMAGFTSISEKMTPEDVTNVLNFYLSSLSDIILEEKGVIDKYIGDCIMAFWNAPLDIDKHRFRAVKAAIRCIRKINELNLVSNIKDIKVRIGINSGYAVVGNMGSNKRFSYTVLGDTVNLASRLEGANKFFGTSIIVSSNVFEFTKNEVVYKYIGNILVPGKTETVEVYEPYKLIDEMTDKDKEFIKIYENGIKYFYEKNYQKSIEYFNKALGILNYDALTIFYYNFANSLYIGKEEFDGIFNIRSK